MAQNQPHIRIAGVDYGGQEPKRGITYNVSGDCDTGDTVAPHPTIAGAVIRCPVDAEPIGVLTTKEKDNRGAVWSFEQVTPVRLTGAVTLGVAKLTGDGAGGIKLAAATAATGLKVQVVGTQTVDGVPLAAVYRL